jgi:uncharacterized SAM-binding protein YcdF (DUF218 family)
MQIFWLALGILSLLYGLFLVVHHTLSCSIFYFWFLFGAYCIFLAKSSRYFLFLSVPMLFFLSLLFVFFFFWIPQKNGKKEAVDLVLILGVRADGTLPESLLFSRAKAGAEWLKENPNAMCLVSGGKVFGETESEAAALRAILIKLGIEKNRILTEEKSRTTKENFLFSFPLFPKGIQKAAVITSSYHLFRAKATAKSTNPPCSMLFSGAESDPLFLPHAFLREFFTFATDLLCGRIKLKFHSEDSI